MKKLFTLMLVAGLGIVSIGCDSPAPKKVDKAPAKETGDHSDMPKDDGAKTDAPADAPVDAPADAPADAPKADAPADAPKEDAPKADAPKEDAPADAPKADAPKKDE